MRQQCLVMTRVFSGYFWVGRESVTIFQYILICLAAGCFACTKSVTIFDLVSSSSFDEYHKVETFPLSQSAKFQLPIFRIETFTFNWNGIALGHQWWPRCQFSSVTLRRSSGHPSSPTVFCLRITFDSEEIRRASGLIMFILSRRVESYAIWPT